MLVLLHCSTNFNISSASQVNCVSLYVIDYADSESGVQFIPPRHNLKIFTLQNCKIANISKDFPRI